MRSIDLAHKILYNGWQALIRNHQRLFAEQAAVYYFVFFLSFRNQFLFC